MRVSSILLRCFLGTHHKYTYPTTVYTLLKHPAEYHSHKHTWCGANILTCTCFPPAPPHLPYTLSLHTLMITHCPHSVRPYIRRNKLHNMTFFRTATARTHMCVSVYINKYTHMRTWICHLERVYTSIYVYGKNLYIP